MFNLSIIIRLVFGILIAIQYSLVVGAEKKVCDQPRAPGVEQNQAEISAYFEQQFTTAEHLRLAAATAGAEWLDTETLLINSRQEAGSGNWNKALQLVHKACFQAESALHQAALELEAWKGRVVN